MNGNPSRSTGNFTVAELAGDYTGPRYTMPRRLGEAIGLVSGDDWKTIEPLVRRMWSNGNPLTWDEARPAIFVTWQRTRRAFEPGHGPSHPRPGSGA